MVFDHVVVEVRGEAQRNVNNKTKVGEGVHPAIMVLDVIDSLPSMVVVPARSSSRGHVPYERTLEPTWRLHAGARSRSLNAFRFRPTTIA